MDDTPDSQILLYRTEDGDSRIDVRMVDETVWLSLNQMADLFQRDKSTISRHINNVFEEGELERSSVVANFATTAADGKTYQVEHYNLDVIISVGYRVKSQRGTQFRIWATRHIRDYLVQGFLLDDERFKNDPDNPYFENSTVSSTCISNSPSCAPATASPCTCRTGPPNSTSSSKSATAPSSTTPAPSPPKKPASRPNSNTSSSANNKTPSPARRKKTLNASSKNCRKPKKKVLMPIINALKGRDDLRVVRQTHRPHFGNEKHLKHPIRAV